MQKKMVGLMTCLMLIGGVAQASVIFGVSGQFASPVVTPFDGTITMDVQGGSVVSLDIDVTGFPGFYNVVSVSPMGNNVQLTATNGVGNIHQLAFLFTTTNPGTLFGFTGGTIVGGSIVSLINPSVPLVFGASGTLTAVPEPTTLALLGLGLGLATLRFSRRKQ